MEGVPEKEAIILEDMSIKVDARTQSSNAFQVTKLWSTLEDLQTVPEQRTKGKKGLKVLQE